MATLTPSEIIMSRDRRGLPVSERIHNVVDTTGGLTDELYNTEIMRTLGKTAPAYLDDSDYNEDAAAPSFGDVLSALDIHDTKDKKAYEIFLEDFPKNVEKYKRKITKNPKYGERGWETVKKIWQQASIDKMNSDIVEGRRKATHGLDEKGDIADPAQWAWAKAASLLTPRSLKAYEEGRDPTASEVLRDVGANAAYAVPFGSFARAASIGRPIASKALGLAAQAAAPTAVAASDILADPEYTGEDLAADVAFGTLTNLGVNRYLAPRIGKWLATSQGRISSRVPKEVKDALQDNPTAKDAAYALIDEANRVKNSPALAKDVIGDLVEGKRPVTPAERAKASDILDIGDAARHSYNFGGKKALSTPEMYKLVLQDSPAEAVYDRMGGMVAGTKGPFVGIDMNDPAAVKAATEKFFKDSERYAEAIKDNPELASLFTKTPLNITPANILKTYAVNQYGSATPGIVGMAMGSAGGNAEKIREWAKESKAEKTHKAAVSEILGGDNLTDTDYRYLEMVKKDPKVLKFSQDPKFKEWLLTRGNDLLRGTPYYRNAWEVE